MRVDGADPNSPFRPPPPPNKRRRRPGRRFHCRATVLFVAESPASARPKKTQYVLGIRLNVQTNVVAEQVAVVQRALGSGRGLRSDVLSVYGGGRRRRRVSRSLQTCSGGGRKKKRKHVIWVNDLETVCAPSAYVGKNTQYY